MEDRVDFLEERLQTRLGEIELDEPEVAVPGAMLEVALLGGARVVVREGVDADRRAASSAERLDQMRADEAGAARDEVRTARLEIVARPADSRAVGEAARQLAR